ncbi:MAG: hypothetical protein K2H98_01415 [Duncaniella sp.]|nr:hypothetical protein [Duncaniella sp.]
MKKIFLAVALMLSCGAFLTPVIIASTSTATLSSQNVEVEAFSGNASRADGQESIYIKVYPLPNSCYSYYAVYKGRNLAVKNSDGRHHYDHLYHYTHMVEVDNVYYYFTIKN